MLSVFQIKNLFFILIIFNIQASINLYKLYINHGKNIFVKSFKEENISMWLLRFLRSNIFYIIWFLFYFGISWVILGGNWQALYISLVIYGVSIAIALCPIGEVLLRATEGCRNPATEREKNYLLPIFEEVYQSAKETNPSLNNNIKIYIMDVMYVNAFAIGRKTVAVTNGALETFTENELKGILAHELGHMTYGHTKALLLSVIGNFFFSVIVLISRILLSIIEWLSEVLAIFNFMGIIFRFLAFIVRIVIELSIFIFVNSGELILSANSRANEVQADRFAFDSGYGKELISSLYLLQKISINTKVKLSERLKASHPHLAYRIEYLEGLENKSTEILV